MIHALGQLVDDAVLQGVDVLILVYEHVGEIVVNHTQDTLVTQQLIEIYQQVVKVDRAHFFLPGLIVRNQGICNQAESSFGKLRNLLVPFFQGNGAVSAVRVEGRDFLFWRKLLPAQVEVGADLFPANANQSCGVRAVENLEVMAEPDSASISTQQTHGDGVKCAASNFDLFFSQQGFDTAHHFVGGFIRKGQHQEGVLRLALENPVGNAVDKNTGLAASRIRDA